MMFALLNRSKLALLIELFLASSFFIQNLADMDAICGVNCTHYSWGWSAPWRLFCFTTNFISFFFTSLISRRMVEWGGPKEKDLYWNNIIFLLQTQPFHKHWAVVWISVFVVMLLPSISTVTSLDFPCWICAFPEWLASQKICPPAMEEVAEVEVDRALGEGEPGVEALRVVRGCTSSRWLREPGQWLYTTLILSNRTASLSTGPCSSFARTISLGSMQSE